MKIDLIQFFSFTRCVRTILAYLTVDKWDDSVDNAHSLHIGRRFSAQGAEEDR